MMRIRLRGLRLLAVSLALIVVATAALCAQSTATEQAAANGGDAPPPASAAAALPASFWSGFQITGLVDLYYGYNYNRPSGLTPYRNFDTRHNDTSLNLAKLTVEKVVDSENPFGFRADLTYGPSTDLINAAEPSRGEAWQHLQQLYGSVQLPVHKGLRLDVGKFVTSFGAEVIETPGNWNYSRSLLFALAIPYYHAGIRATFPVHDRFTVTGLIVNGWNDVQDRNDSKSGGISFTVKPHDKLTLTHTYMGGRETDPSGLRHMNDTVIAYTVNDKISLLANIDYGRDSLAGSTVSWSGAAFYAKFQVADSVALVPRYEFFRDRDGFMTGAAQTLQEITLTGEYRVKNGPVLRLEYRHDDSDEPVFLDHRDVLRFGQNTLTVGAYFEIPNLVPWLRGR